MYALMVIVLSSEHINVQSDARSDRERVEDMREHLRREVPDLLALDAEVAHAVRARADVDDRAREGLCGARASLH